MVKVGNIFVANAQRRWPHEISRRGLEKNIKINLKIWMGGKKVSKALYSVDYT